MALTRAQIKTNLANTITDELERQNTAAIVRERLEEIIDNCYNIADDDLEITTDATPADGSTNPVQSGGVYDADQALLPLDGSRPMTNMLTFPNGFGIQNPGQSALIVLDASGAAQIAGYLELTTYTASKLLYLNGSKRVEGVTIGSGLNLSGGTLTATGIDYTPNALTDASSMALTHPVHTLTTSSATRTFTISYTGNDITIELILNTTGSVFTFPASSLCVSEGVASGDNTCTLAGVSGDKYVIAIKKIGSNYYVACKNFGQ